MRSIANGLQGPIPSTSAGPSAGPTRTATFDTDSAPALIAAHQGIARERPAAPHDDERGSAPRGTESSLAWRRQTTTQSTNKWPGSTAPSAKPEPCPLRERYLQINHRLSRRI